MGKELIDKIDKMIESLEYIKKELEKDSKNSEYEPFVPFKEWKDLYPTKDIYPIQNYAICRVCGINLKEMTHYVCNHSSCPSRVTCM